MESRTFQFCAIEYRELPMPWNLLLAFAMITGDPAAAAPRPQVKTAQASKAKPSPKLVSASMPSAGEDSDAEGTLLEMANESRRQAGLPPLHMSDTLMQAARAHARVMVEHAQLSHQFSGEVSLGQRLALAGVRYDHAGENVAYNYSAENAAEAFMQSPPHRDNLLDPQFDEAGIVAVWSDGRLYVVEDFAHEMLGHATSGR
jgi:uncharacterized protein YkwD